MIIRATLLASALVVLPAAAGAQTAAASAAGPQGTAKSTVFADAVAAGAPGLAAATQPSGQQIRKDPLWNGVIIGAGLGAIAGALIGDALLPCSECSGFDVPLTFGVIGAGAGAGIGAGIDAAWHQRSPIGSQPGRTRRLKVSPVVSKSLKGVVGTIVF